MLHPRPGTMARPRRRSPPHSSSTSTWRGVLISGRSWPAWLGEPRGNQVMPYPDDPLDSVQDRVAIPDLEALDFSSTDPATTLAKVRLLTAAATYFNTIAVAEFGGRLGPLRAPGMLEGVIGAAFQTFGGVDPHPEAFDKAAMLLRGITQGHPFNDGNKRTGFLTASYFLELVGYPLPAVLDVDAAVALCMRVSAGDMRAIDAIARALALLWHSP